MGADPRLDEARTALAKARNAHDRLLGQVAGANADITTLSRTASPQDRRLSALKESRDSLTRELEDSHERVRSSRSDLHDLISQFLGREGDQDFTRLAVQLPIALFPVRIETRFDITPGRPPFLKIRVYPDEIMADSHEPAFTAKEKADGEAYWLASKEKENLKAWQQLLVGRSPQRAAWIAHALDPSLQGPPPGERFGTWSRAVESHILPDRWVALAYRGGQEVHRAVSSPVVEPLTLTMNPNQNLKDRTAISDELLVANDLLWTMDFDLAKQAGMGFEMSIEPSDLEQGFDRLLVFGVKASLDPQQAGQRLADLLDNHHYTRGLAFVRQGTPTNNTSDGPAGYPPDDPDGSLSFAIERGKPLPSAASDGPGFMRALGVPETLADHLDGAQGSEQASARAMNAALWPVTLGYFLEHIMEPAFDDNAVDSVRRYFLDNVRGRGPLPALRVGSVPYGLLPVTSLARWEPDRGATGPDAQVPPLLRTLLPYWLNKVAAAPHVGQTGDPDADLTRVLAMEASMRELGVRVTVGALVYKNLFAFSVIDGSAFEQSVVDAGTKLLAAIGHPELAPRLVQLVFQEAAHKFKFAFVTEKPLSETAPLDPNYIQTVMQSTTLAAFRAVLALIENEPTVLLYRLLHQGALLEGARDSYDLLIQNGLATRDDRRTREFNAIAATATPQATVWDHLSQTVSHVTGSLGVADYVFSPVFTLFNPRVQEYRGALGVLAGLPTAELERLLTETLDVSSHRLDAWITSLASSRLRRMRERQPLGVHIGAFAWVENLSAKVLQRRSTVTLPDGRTVSVQSDNGGFIHAPSMPHGAAAAVLRNAYIGQVGGREPYEIDMSSSKVRGARWILDSIREGQPAGGVFGYLFERGLHDAELDQYIDILRGLFPLVFNPVNDSGLPAEKIAARNVVDGLALRTSWLAQAAPFFGPGGIITLLPDFAAIKTEIVRMVAAMDPVADLLVSESVYHLARTNTFAAASTLDAAAGAHPPEPQIAEQPRSGTALTHRVALVLGGAPPASPWPGPLTPRARANPYVNAWAGNLLGDPAAAVCLVNRSRQVRLVDLELQPLDVLALAKTVAVTGQVGELDRRVSEAAKVAVSEISYAGPFQQILELAQTINSVLEKCRVLTAQDLTLPQELGKANIKPSPNPDARNRAAAARQALIDLQSDLDAAITTKNVVALRARLKDACLFGIGESFPVSQDAGLLDQAQIVKLEVNRRVELANAPGIDPAALGKAVFGREFLLIEPFEPPFPAEVDLAIARGQAAAFGSDRRAVLKWMQQATRVRPALGAWRKLGLYASALDRTPLDLDIAQIPFDAQARWVALPFAAEKDRPTSGHLSLALHRAATPSAGASWFGLCLDDWTETIPNIKETTGVAFHYDDPGAEAAQAVLLAVPPGGAQAWDLDTVAAVLNETLDLAHIRAVDLELLGPLGQLIPAIYLPTDEAKNTVSADLSSSVIRFEQGIILRSL